ncbi:TIGR01777 family oxidoreductase [Actinocorallia libanotica]|uniref:TIGR01777 family oxidoreductase n=1 Tax=Actinocorallia libanotica TaxID=46162 RepID=A0ABN1RYD3_9ACTN
MRAIISGASGLIGEALVARLCGEGFDVLRLVRRAPSRPDEAFWDPAAGEIDRAALEGADAVVHLAGAGVGDRPWTESYKRLIRDSRVRGTRLLAETLAGLKSPPSVLVSGSAIGFYGDTGAAETTESAPKGAGFLADLTADWEAASAPAAAAGIRVVLPRTGIVLSRRGGILGRTLPLFRLGAGGRLGDGRQWTSWISLRDEVGALRHLIGSDLSGPVNLTAPSPVTNAEYTRELARVLRRPAVLPVPAPLLRLVLRDFADEGPLVSQRVLPVRLLESGFSFADPDLPAALKAALEA